MAVITTDLTQAQIVAKLQLEAKIEALTNKREEVRSVAIEEAKAQVQASVAEIDIEIGNAQTALAAIKPVVTVT